MSDKRVARLSPRHRFSARTRLAFSYALMVMICGTVLLTVLVLYLGFGPDYAFDSAAGDGHREPVIIVLSDPSVLKEGFSLTVENRQQFISLLIRVSALVLVVLAGISSVAAWWLAGRMLRPLADINDAARLAASGRLDHRIGLRGPRDEIVDLAQTFDAMLESIERSSTAQRRFAANASHELRTPLATSKTMIDVALAAPGDVDRRVLERLAQVNERSIRTVESLLDLAQAEMGDQHLGTVSLPEIVAGVLDQHASAAERRGLRVERSLAPAQLVGDERLVVQLVHNLVENAISHNIDGGQIAVTTETVRAADGSAAARLTVSNTGEHLEPEAIGDLTEPFRTAAGRAGGTSRGLGLSIVAAIVSRAEGTLEISAREPGGLTVEVTFPERGETARAR